jgi:hypothetical protein
VQRNIDELWRQVAGLRQLTGINEDAINAVLVASREPDAPPGETPPPIAPGQTPEEPTPTEPAFQWTDPQPVDFDSEDGTGYGTGSRVSTLEYTPTYKYRILSMTIQIHYQTPASDSPGAGGVFLNIGGGVGGDVLVTTWNLSTLSWYHAQVRILSGDAIESGGSSRQFSPGQAMRFDHRPSSSPSGVRITAKATMQFYVPVTGS